MKRVVDNICLHKYENRQLPALAPPPLVWPLVAFALHVASCAGFVAAQCVTSVAFVMAHTEGEGERERGRASARAEGSLSRAPLTIFGYCQVAIYVLATLHVARSPSPFMVR